MADTEAEPVQVFIRVRPELVGDYKNDVTKGRHEKSVLGFIDDKTVRISPPDQTGVRKPVAAVDDKVFTYDKVFSDTCNQEDVYDSVSQMVRATVRGYNTTIFAYGSTGSGKSYTMTGNSAAPGIIPRAISEIFSMIENMAADENDVYFYVRLSYVELYNNNFRNLLEFASKELAAKEMSEKLSSTTDMSIDTADSGTRRSSSSIDYFAKTAGIKTKTPTSPTKTLAHRGDKIEVRESTSAGVFLAGPNLRIPVTSAQEAFQLIAKGNKLRAIGSTNCNDVSSRSHAILTLHVESRVGPSRDNDSSAASATGAELRLGKMHLVDLAGSERLAMSGAEGETLLETQNINLSLSALGDVLSALSRNASVASHAASKSPGKLTTPGGSSAYVPVPYRNSKLTHLLKDSLGGNSKTIMITNIRTGVEYYQQTSISLMYASRAKKVRNRSLVNRNIIGDTGIHAVTSEIERLKSRLDDRATEFERLRRAHMQDANENVALKERLQELHIANDKEKKQLESQMKHVIHSQAGQLVTQRQKIATLQNELQNELALSQNRIAEQEREIKWLKKALDESALAIRQPVDQMERMQKVLDAWQSQAKGSQKELAAATAHSEELESINRTLGQDLEATQAALEASDAALKLANEELKEAKGSLRHTETELDSVRSGHSAMQSDYTRLLNEETRMQRRLLDIERNERTLKSALERMQTDLKNAQEAEGKAKRRLHDAEKNKHELQSRLQTTISQLEEKTSAAVEGAVKQIQGKDEQMRAAEERAKRAANECAILQAEVVSLRSQFGEKTEHFEEMQSDLQTTIIRERESASQTSARASSLESLSNELSEKLSQTKARLAKTEAELASRTEAFAKELKSRAEEVQGMRSIHRAEMDKFQQDMDAKVKNMLEKHRVEIMKRNDASLHALAEKESTLAEAYKRETDHLKTALDQKEVEFKRSVMDIEKRIREENEEELKMQVESVERKYAKERRQLTEMHEQNTEALRDELMEESKQRVCSLEAELKSMKKEHAESIAAITSDHGNVLADTIQRMEIERQTMIDACKSELLSAHRVSIQQADAENNRAISDLKSLHVIEIDRLQKAYEAKLDATLEDAARKSASAVTEAETKLKMAFTTYKNKLEKKVAYREAELADKEVGLIEQHKKAVRDLEKKLRDEFAAHVAAEKDKADEQRRLEVMSASDLSVNEARIQFEKEGEKRIASLQEDFESRLETRLGEEKAAFDVLMQEALSAERNQLEAIRNDCKCQIAALQNDIDGQKREHTAALLALSGEQKEALLLAISNERSLFEQEKDTALRELQASCDKAAADSYALLVTEHETAIKELVRKQEEDVHRIVSEKDALITNLRNEVNTLTASSQETLVSSLNEQQDRILARHRGEAEKLRNEILDCESRHQSDLTALSEKHVRELSAQRKQLESAHDSVLVQMTAELMAVKEQLGEAKASFEAEKQNLVSIHKQEIADYDSRVSDLTGSMEDAQKEFAEACRVKVQAQIEELEAQMLEDQRVKLEDQAASHRKELAGIRLDEHKSGEDRLMSVLDDLAKGRERYQDLTLALTRQQADFDREKMSLLEEHRSALLTQETKHRAEISDAERRYQEDTSSIQTIHTESMQARIESMSKTHNEDLQNLRDQHASSIQRIEEAHKDELVALDESFSEKLEKLQLTHASTEAQLQTALDEIDKLETLHAKTMKSLCDDNDSVIEQLKAHHADTVKENEAASEARRKHELEEVRKAFRAELSSKEKDFSEQICRLEATLKGAQDRLALDVQEHIMQTLRMEEEHSKAMREADMQKAAELQTLREEHEESMRRLRDESSNNVVHAQAELRAQSESDRNEALRKTEEELKKAAHELDVSRGVIEATKRQRKEFESRCVELDMHNRSLQSRIDTFEKSLSAIHENESSQMSLLREQVATSQDDLRAERARLQRLLDTEKDVYRQELQAARDESSKHRSDAAREIQSLTDRVFDYTEKLAARSNEVERLKADLAKVSEVNAEKCKILETNLRAEYERRLVEKDNYLQTQLQSAQSSVDSSMQKFLQESTQKRREEQYLWEKERKELLDQSKAQEVLVCELRRYCEDGNKKVEEMREKTEKMRQELKGSVEAALRSGEELEDMTDKRDALRVELDRMHVKLQQARNSVQSHETYEGSLQDSLQRAEERIREQMRTSLGLSMQVETLTNEVELSKTEATAKEKTRALEIETLQSQLQSKDRKIAESLQDLRKEKATASSLEKMLAKHSEETKLLRASAQADQMKLRQAFADKLNTEFRNRCSAAEAKLAATVSSAVSAERDRQEAKYSQLLREKDLHYKSELQRMREDKHDAVHNKYMTLMQNQVNSLLEAIGTGKSQKFVLPQIEELHNSFLSMIEDLPQLLKSSYCIDLEGDNERVNAVKGSSVAPSEHDKRTSSGAHGRHAHTGMLAMGIPPSMKASADATLGQRRAKTIPSSSEKKKTPLHSKSPQYEMIKEFQSEGSCRTPSITGDRNSRAHTEAMEILASSNVIVGNAVLPWSSPTLSALPGDQLTAAILDGDVQGIRTVVRSRGDNLRAPFWFDLCKSILPLHRAISGLHFHGSEKLLVSTIETLAILGAEVSATDHAGNTPLHKALLVCTSKCVSAVVKALLKRGASANSKNNEGDAPLHIECKRLRSASADVVTLCIRAGADARVVNSTSTHKSVVKSHTGLTAASTNSSDKITTPLALVLAQATPSSYRIRHGAADDASVATDLTTDDTGMEVPRSTVTSGVWIRTAEALMQQKSCWNPNWRSAAGCSQLHAVFEAFPPPKTEFNAYRRLVSSALRAGLALSDEDAAGCSALQCMLRRLAKVPASACPTIEKLLASMAEAAGEEMAELLCGSRAHTSFCQGDTTQSVILGVRNHVAGSCLERAHHVLVKTLRLVDGGASIGSKGSISGNRYARPGAQSLAMSSDGAVDMAGGKDTHTREGMSRTGWSRKVIEGGAGSSGGRGASDASPRASASAADDTENRWMIANIQ